MKQFFKMFFASLLAMVIAAVILVGFIIGMITKAVTEIGKSSDKPALVTESLLLLKTSDRVHELGSDNSLASFSNSPSFSAGLYDMIRALKAAKTDDKIKGVILKLDGGSNGWATLEQIREAILDFKKAGKKVYAYGDAITQRDYFLATAADSIFLNPAGMLEFKGLASQLMFFKGTLDKLGVQPEIFYAGRFKSATEPFRVSQMSPANRQQIAAMQQDIWSVFLKATAKKTGLDSATIQSLVQNGGLYFAGDAVKNHLIDGAEYWDEIEDKFRLTLGKKADEKMPYVSINSYASQMNNTTLGEGRVAVLFAEGEIVDGKAGDYQISPENLVKSIRQIRRDDKVKAVVLRVNSPGGSALASEVILRELQLLKAKKPLIVSMGDLAASGGYYIASQADSIFAMPNTLTGSIGVFGMLFNVGNALESKLGITFDEEKNAPFADFPTMSRTLTPAEESKMQATIDTIYATFKAHVVSGRKLSPVLVDSLAQGRVWSGEDALALGLVDGIGGINRAIESAANKAKLKTYSVTTYPEPVNQLQSLIDKVAGGTMSTEQLSSLVSKQLLEESTAIRELMWMKRISGRAQMMLPFRVLVN
ncbi:MAG: signal peptide peptidase SppA [Bacteroidetes bacterium]|nr:signal peptide peptidase SppA [Bacteroidota bacterium]